MTKYFYDSYAIIEYLNGNPYYQKYFIESEGITSFYNLMEVYYSLLKDNAEDKANELLILFKHIIVEPLIDDIKNSMKFRFKYRKIKFSYADCLGYAIAKRSNFKFLTGDEGFKNINGVEFVK